MKKRDKAKIRLIVLIALILIAIILLILLFSPIFNIRNIDVGGSLKYSHEEIVNSSELKLGENAFRRLRIAPEAIFELRLLDAEKKIKQLPYVKECTVKIVFPNSIRIQITDRDPAAYLVYFDNYLTVDEQGFVLEVGNNKSGDNLKEIRGIDFNKYSLGGQLEASDISLIRIGVEIISTINRSDGDSETKLADVLDWVDIINDSSAMISLDNRIIVRFNPKDKLQYTMDFTKEIFFKKISTNESGRIEFSGDQYPNFTPD